MNFFILDDLILRRLRERLPSVGTIYSAGSLEEVVERSEVKPLVALVYSGYSKKDANPGAVQVIQRWTVVVGVDAMNYAEPAQSARMAAGEIVTDVIKVLQGYGPVEYPNVKRLSLSQGEGAYLENGLLLVPLVFESNVILSDNLV